MNPDPLAALNPLCGSVSATAQGLEDGGWHSRTYRREHAVMIFISSRTEACRPLQGVSQAFGSIQQQRTNELPELVSSGDGGSKAQMDFLRPLVCGH